SEVVFGGAALVAVPLDGDVNVGMLLQEPRIALQRCLIGCAHIVLVVIEVNVLHVLREEFLLGGGRSRCRRRWRRVDGDASGGVLGSASAFRDEMVGGRVSRSHLARAARVHRADSVDADVGGVRGLPSQGCRLSLVDSVWATRPRRTLAMICLAVLVQMNGVGSSLWLAT